MGGISRSHCKGSCLEGAKHCSDFCKQSTTGDISTPQLKDEETEAQEDEADSNWDRIQHPSLLGKRAPNLDLALAFEAGEDLKLQTQSICNFSELGLVDNFSPPGLCASYVPKDPPCCVTQA